MPKANEKNGAATDHTVQIQRRQLGYAFGGPDASWCEPAKKGEMKLPVNPADNTGENVEQREFTGCLKYSECELIDDDVRWRPWEELSDSQRETLKRLRCYRATAKWWNPETKTLDSQRRAGWDPNVLQSRHTTREEKAQWIGNPFGVRTPELGTLARNIRSSGGEISEHRDLSPCPLGGCVTPEMQRDYLWKKRTVQNEWANMQACPFFYRHVDSELSTATPNPQRFTQCYVTLKPVRDLLANAGIVAVAPIFRASQSTRTIGDAFWYPFYSGFSFLQLPTWSPEPLGWSDPTMQLRWQATTTVRQQTARVFRTLPIQKLFEGVEEGKLLVDWETKVRILSVSDGQAGALLLQWLLISRLEAVCANTTERLVDIAGELEWLYEKPAGRSSDKGVCSALTELGYDLEQTFGIKVKQNGAFRCSTLHDDFLMLGLLDERDRPTDRLKATVLWLNAICQRATTNKVWDLNREEDLGSAVLDWLGQEAFQTVQKRFKHGRCDRQSLNVICWLLIRAAAGTTTGLPDLKHVAKEGLNRIVIDDRDAALAKLRNYKEDKFSSICRLVPPVHVLVRANWQTPVRWIFVPIGEASQVSEDENGKLRARISSGLIILLKDDFKSSPYDPDLKESQDRILMHLWNMRRIISAVARIEEAHVRDDLILAKEWWDFQRPFADSVQHLIRTLKGVIDMQNDPSSNFVSRVLTNLESIFVVPPEEPVQEGPVTLDLKSIVHDAINDFNELFQARKNTSTKLVTSGSNFMAKVKPLVGTYKSDNDAARELRTAASLKLLLVDLLNQRAVKKEATMSIILRDLSKESGTVAIDIMLPSKFLLSQFVELRENYSVEKTGEGEDVVWDSTTTPLSFWPRGRGFYLTFFFARALGSVRQRVFNCDKNGVISLEFERGEL